VTNTYAYTADYESGSKRGMEIEKPVNIDTVEIQKSLLSYLLYSSVTTALTKNATVPKVIRFLLNWRIFHIVIPDKPDFMD
jgi:methylmalonyl-CoA mutase N-terminal domain/subunit